MSYYIAAKDVMQTLQKKPLKSFQTDLHAIYLAFYQNIEHQRLVFFYIFCHSNHLFFFANFYFWRKDFHGLISIAVPITDV